MVFNALQNTAFFTNGPQMNLPAAICLRLQQEGLTVVEDFADFKEEQFEEAYKNMRTSIPGIPVVQPVLDANRNVQVAGIPAVPPIMPALVVSARYRLCLGVPSTAIHYYTSIGHGPTSMNMNYTMVLKWFYTKWEVIVELAKEDKPDVPILHKNSTPLKWIESFRDCIFCTYGVRKAPLSYMICENVEVPAEADDPLLQEKAHGESGSVIDEMIKRLSHDDPLYCSDNALVYSMLEESTRGKVYASTIKPFSRAKDGRAAWLAMSSHSGSNKWEQLYKERSSS